MTLTYNVGRIHTFFLPSFFPSLRFPHSFRQSIGLPNKPPSEDSTICHVGCAMTSLSMLLASLNTTTDWLIGSRQVVTPKSLNTWLTNNYGYDCVQVGSTTAKDIVCFNLMSSALVNLTGRLVSNGYNPKVPSLHQLQENIQNETMSYIAHVKNGHHFVLVTGVDVQKQQLSVLDPYFNVTSYPYENVSGILSYTRRDSVVPRQYPTFKQCDDKWKADLMVNTTVCKVGCLMSSTSMALAAHGIDIHSVSSNPGSFNAWLRTNHGYVGANNFEEDAVDRVSSLLPKGSVVWPKDGMHVTNDLSIEMLREYIQDRVVIANVLKGRHFVLVVGIAGKMSLESDDYQLIVNDPGFNRTTYMYQADVVGWRIFDMK